ncbi:4-oxalomesaconate tautomerase [Pseudomonas sp. NGC7]|uniref:4-oxalomesaconate tautomerase n=1 Tax=Pseudomonas sp. NGC7 TaxID=3341775 RepID=UPI0037DBA12C
MSQLAIPCLIVRGGTSKGVFFLREDLPQDSILRDQVLLAVMGSPDSRQIDGLGGGDSLTSKVAIIAPSSREGVDVDYLFAQVLVSEARVDYGQNCGNILAGVGPAAIELGLVSPKGAETSVSIFMENTGQIANATIQTPSGAVIYEGTARIDGVPGTAAPILIEFADIAGSSCGALLPTGNVIDLFDGVEVTCIDNGMPVVIIKASDLDVTGYESPAELDSNGTLKQRLESIRLQAGRSMNLGDVTNRTIPKMCIVATPAQSGTISSRSFIPHKCHTAIGVFGAVSVATACRLEGSTAYQVAQSSNDEFSQISVEHPTGEFTVTADFKNGALQRSGLLRTARLISRGQVYIPAAVWK